MSNPFRFLLSVLAFVFVSGTVALAQLQPVVPDFNEGDTVSAQAFNELFETIDGNFSLIGDVLQPVFASVQVENQLIINPDTDTALPFTITKFATSGTVSTINGFTELVATRPGVYQVSFTLTWPHVPADLAGIERDVRIFVGNVLVPGLRSHVIAAGRNTSVSGLVALQPGDTVTVVVSHNAATNRFISTASILQFIRIADLPVP